jgi:hypothetical protein
MKRSNKTQERKRYIRKSKPSVILKEKRESYYLLTGMWQHYLHIVEFWYDSMNGTILDITFKFMIGFNMWLIFDYFYASRKKRRLFNHFNLMFKQ